MCVSCMYTNFYTCFEVKLTKLNENKTARNKKTQARGQNKRHHRHRRRRHHRWNIGQNKAA